MSVCPAKRDLKCAMQRVEGRVCRTRERSPNGWINNIIGTEVELDQVVWPLAVLLMEWPVACLAGFGAVGNSFTSTAAANGLSIADATGIHFTISLIGHDGEFLESECSSEKNEKFQLREKECTNEVFYDRAKP